MNDADALDELLGEERVDTIYHAAAYKHVPIVEAQPERGVTVNVFGTLAVVEAALRHHVADVVLVSSDKAVRPANAMGATKRIAEMILQAKACECPDTRFSMVRFGNVLGSSGSVVPKFQEQIEAGGPVTITDRRMTRFFMTIPEAAQLVLQASAIAQGGEVFVLDMGKEVSIEQLARTMIERHAMRSGRATRHPIEIVEVGMRPGEKLYEELFIDDSCRRTAVGKIFTANEHSLPWPELAASLERMRAHDRRRDREALLALLHETVARTAARQAPALVVSNQTRRGTSDRRAGEETPLVARTADRRSAFERRHATETALLGS